MKEIVKLSNKNCTKCPFKQLEIITFSPETIIKSCTKCNNNE